MDRVRLVMWMAGCLAIGAVAMAQERNVHVIVSDEPRSIDEKDVHEVQTLAEKTIQALELGDTDLIGGYMADDYFCIDMSGKAIDKPQRLKQIREAGLKFTHAATEQQSVRSYGTTMLVTGVLDVKGSMIGRDLTGRYRYLDVWVKRGGKWMAVASTMTAIATPAAQQATPGNN